VLAILKTKPGTGLEMKEVEMPEITGPRDVRVRVKRASICGSDIHIYKWDNWAQNHIHPPMVVGHEFSGTVVETGSAVTRVSKGDYVVAETHIPCEKCYQCRTGRMHICRNMKILGVDRDGAFAEFIVVPETVLWKVSSDIPEEYASVMEPFGNAIHTCSVENLLGKTVLITGAGPIGVMAVQLARVSGASLVIVSEIKPYRKRLALDNGADVVIDPTEKNLVEEVMKLTDGDGVDVLLEMSGSEKALIQGLEALTKGGLASILGVFSKEVSLNIDSLITFKGITLHGITGRDMFKTWRIADQLLKSKRVDLSKVVTHVIPFKDWKKGFDIMMRGECGKIVMEISD